MAKKPDDVVTIPVIAQDAFDQEANAGTPPAPPTTGKTFTESEVEQIRREEKDKLYSRLEASDSKTKDLESRLNVLSTERERQIAEAQEAARKEAEIVRQREHEELSAKDLLKRTEDEFNSKIQDIDKEWQERFNAINAAREQDAAILQKEIALRDLEVYRQRRITESADTIIPELLDLISGTSVEEIDTSVSQLTERSAAIIKSVQQATQTSRVKGTVVTSPSSGPMDNQMEQHQLTADDIRSMTMDQYVKMRDRLLVSRPKGRY